MGPAVTAQSGVVAVGTGWVQHAGDEPPERMLSFSLFLQIKYGDTATSEGVLFATYSALIGESQAGGQHRTRLKQILDWCRENFDGVVSFRKETAATRKLDREELHSCDCASARSKELGAI